MNKILGFAMISLGSLSLSFEFYFLRFIYIFSYGVTPDWKPSPLSYLSDPSVEISVGISLALIVLGCYVVLKNRD